MSMKTEWKIGNTSDISLENLSYAQAEKRALTIHKTSQNYNNQFIAN